MNINSKIRILHLCNNDIGGMSAVAESLKKLFNGKVFNSEIIYLSNDNIRYPWFLKILIEYLNFRKKMITKIDKVNVFHFHGGWTLHLLPLLWGVGQSSVVSPHGAFHQKALNKSAFKKEIVSALFMKKAYLNSKCIHALTEKEARDIYNYGIKSTPIALIPNGIDLNYNLTVDESLKKYLYKKSKNRRVVLSLSRIHVAKGVHNLINAFSEVVKLDKNCVLFIVGDGEEDYCKELNLIVEKFNLIDNVFFLGPMNGISKNTVYNVSDVFVLPSLNEGFPLTVLEAYRSKIPVITTTETPFSEIEEIGCGWYVKPTVDDLTRALYSAVTTDKSKLNSMGEIGYEWVKNNYSLDIIEKMYKELYVWISKNGDLPSFVSR